uniref:Probable membrane transporter protein n=1 Tax=candidate division WWE3 bacterium TaxID=2053526 RepID=A0A831Z057_UNCKA
MLNGFTSPEVILFLVFAFFAEILGTLAGFGSSMILIPLAALFIDVKTAIAVVGLFHFFGQVVDLFLWGRYVDWRITILFAGFGVIFSFLGAALITVLPSQTVLLILGMFLVAYAAASLWGKKLTLPKSNLSILSIGGAVGFFAGLTGTAGAMRTAFLSTLGLAKANFLGTSNAIAFFVDFTRVTVYAGSGILKFDLPFWAAVLGVSILGSLIGRKVVLRIKEKTFYRVVSAALLLAGLKFIFS